MKKRQKFIIVAAALILLSLGYKFYFLPLMFPFDKGIKAYVIDKVTPIKSIDPNELNFQDLNVLKEAIGEASLVLLGEQDHGDAPTFLAKTRIIKFLHQEMDFDVLVFESDFIGINQTWDLAKAGEGSLDGYRNNIYPLWANCAE